MNCKHLNNSICLVPVIFICLSLLSPQPANAQFVGAQYKGQTGVQHDFIIYDEKGQPVPVGDHSNVGGTPFLQSDWTFGTIILTNGRSLSDSMVNYSLYNDRLYFRRENRVYQIDYAVRSFTIQNRQAGSDKKLFHFQNGFPSAGSNDSTTFYEVLSSGTDVQLLKWEQKKVREVYNYGGAYESNYTSVYEYFIYYPGNKKMVSLGSKPGLKKLIAEMPFYKSEIDKYCATHKVDMKSETDLVSFMSSQNSTAH